MSQAAIAAIEAIQASGVGATGGAAEQGAAAPGFVNWIGHEMNALNGQLKLAEQGVQQLALGQTDNLHGVMLQLEQARLALQVAAQVRSRVLEAYQEVMRMQV